MDQVLKNHTKVVKKIIPKAKKEITIPSWMNKTSSSDEISDEELQELEKEMEIFN